MTLWLQRLVMGLLIWWDVKLVWLLEEIASKETEIESEREIQSNREEERDSEENRDENDVNSDGEIDSESECEQSEDETFRNVNKRQWFVIYRCPYRQLWLWLNNFMVTGNWSECYTWKRSVNCNTSIIREWYRCVPSEPRKRGKDWGICWNFGTAMAVVSHFRNSGYSR
jgi:hypothetical protein